ncbi:SgcJ/EcaC family oxidoreductase [Fibrella sp. HMF5036]|uniref:SgcJ/EcaC family oxidoreductase n=2 Tax=Fibrella aquatilis TaxID=2817059 RepID=A0A939G8A9_9BACT|nr:SgcJ/EcaC family oxidoreductase [Fibrella aquatilis]
MLAALLTLLFGTAYGQKSTMAADEKAIQNTVDAMLKSWHTHNYNDIATWATPDADWVNVVGMWWKGREEVRLAHQVFHDMFFKTTPLTQQSLTIRFVTPEVAIGHLLWHIGAYYPPDGIDHGTNKRPEGDDLATLVFVKKDGKWLLTAAQNVSINAQAAASNPVTMSRK